MKKTDGLCQVNLVCGHPKMPATFTYYLVDGRPCFARVDNFGAGVIQFYRPNKTTVFCCGGCKAAIEGRSEERGRSDKPAAPVQESRL